MLDNDMMKYMACANDSLVHIYNSLMDMEDCILRKNAFKQISEKRTDVYLFNGTDELNVSSNFLSLRFKGPITIENNLCKVPVEYWCTDPCGDVWQNISIYDKDSFERFGRIDYMNSFTDTIFEFCFEGEDFLIIGIDTSCEVETHDVAGMILIGIDVSDIPVINFATHYNEIILDNEADWNEIPVHSFELEIKGEWLPLSCKKVDTRYVYLSLETNSVQDKYSFTVSDLVKSKFKINVNERDAVKSYTIPYSISDAIESFGSGYLNLPDLCKDEGLKLDFLTKQ